MSEYERLAHWRWLADKMIHEAVGGFDGVQPHERQLALCRAKELHRVEARKSIARA